MLFIKNDRKNKEQSITERYLRNLTDSQFEKTVEIIKVYREADKKAQEIEADYLDKAVAEFGEKFEKLRHEDE